MRSAKQRLMQLTELGIPVNLYEGKVSQGAELIAVYEDGLEYVDDMCFGMGARKRIPWNSEEKYAALSYALGLEGISVGERESIDSEFHVIEVVTRLGERESIRERYSVQLPSRRYVTDKNSLPEA